MKKFIKLLAILSIFPLAAGASVSTSPAALEATQVVTSGTYVILVSKNTAYNACYIQNDPMSVTYLVIDPVNIASHSNPSSTASFIAPGNTYVCPFNNVAGPITADAYDNNHKIYGIKY